MRNRKLLRPQEKRAKMCPVLWVHYSLRQCEDSLDASDRSENERISDGSIEFKEDPEWAAEYNRLKTVLTRREHIPKGVALVEMRREKARMGKALDRRTGNRKPRRPH